MTRMLVETDPEFGPTVPGIFLDHASVSPPCRAARRAVHEAIEAIAGQDPEVLRSRDTMDRARDAFASLVESRRDRVQCFANTTSALACVARGLPWRRGDEVLVSPNEFVSNLLIWQQQARHGARVRYLPTPDEQVRPEILEQAINDRTKVVAVSAVHWATGAKQDLRALSGIAHDHGALLVVDAAQSLGAALHSQRSDGYDVLASNTYKWLLSVNGTGFADFSPDAIDQLADAATGWLGVAGEPEPDALTSEGPSYPLGEGVERLAGGAPSVLSNMAAVAAFDALRSRGLARIASEVRAIAKYALDEATARGITSITPEHAGLVALDVSNAADVAHQLASQDIRLTSRGGRLRVAPHFYTPRSDIDALFDALDSLHV